MRKVNTLDNGLKPMGGLIVAKCNPFILDETQEDRDLELSNLLNMPLDRVKALSIATPGSIRIFDEKLNKPKDLTSLYSNYEYLNFPAYLKTLMFTSVTKRHKELFELLRSTYYLRCLDFGSGCGSHSIGLLQHENEVDSLDVPGKLQEFTRKRIANRKLLGSNILSNTDELINNSYDTVICSDTLEHVPNPLVELERIYKAMCSGAVIHLLVSTMVKPSSGHFPESIAIWKTEGKKFMSKNFINIGETLWRKK